jgi:X-X-X-Leu-X-X-Gly heptad repeat protein
MEQLQAGLQQLREGLNDLKSITTSWFNPSQTTKMVDGVSTQHNKRDGRNLQFPARRARRAPCSTLSRGSMGDWNNARWQYKTGSNTLCIAIQREQPT